MKVTGGLSRLLAFALPFVFLVALLVTAWIYVDQSSIAANVMDRAGRQRLLARDILTQAQAVALGRSESTARLRESLAEFDAGLTALERGGLWKGVTLPPAPDDARDTLARAHRERQSLDQAIEQLGDSERQAAALATIREGSNRLGASATDVVEVIEHHADTMIARSLWMLAVAIGANLLLLVFSLWYARRDAGSAHATAKSLRESDERFRQLADHIEEVFWVCTPDGSEVEYVSPGYELIWGRTCESLLERPMEWTEAIHPEDRERVHAAFIENLSQGRYDQVFRIVRPDGEIRWVHDRGFAVKNEQGETVRIAGIAADITRLKAAAEELARAEAEITQVRDEIVTHTSALNLVELQLRAVVEHLPDGVCLLGPDRSVVLTNEAGATYLERLGSGLDTGSLARLGDIDTGEMLLGADAGKPREITHEESGSVYVASAVPLAGGAEGWVLVVRDVSAERANQDQKQQQERLASVGQLAAGIAHDFNNLLTVMIGTAQLLERSDAIQDEEREQLRQISVQGERATRLVRQILDFSRATAVERKPLDLVPFLGEMIRMVRRILPATISIEVDIQPEQCVVHANLSQLQQALTNLVANARDAMSNGGTLHITLSDLHIRSGTPVPVAGLEPGDYALWTVTDTGRGMPPEVVARVFEPFFTTKAPGQGTGLGLAQLYGIVMQHEGQIDVRSELDRGTTFTLYLPRSVHADARPAAAQSGMPMGKRETVLLVEDEAPVRDAVQAMLEALDYRVLPASDGREALSLFGVKRDEIDAVLTDVVMPEMGGLELWAALRVRDQDVPVIAMSGYPLGTFEGDAEGSALPEEISGYLQKPVVLRQLAQALKHALDPGTN